MIKENGGAMEYYFSEDELMETIDWFYELGPSLAELAASRKDKNAKKLSKYFKTAIETMETVYAIISENHIIMQWLPADEPPEEDGLYIVTFEANPNMNSGKPYKGVSRYMDGEWVEVTECKVEYWMPFPPIYEDESNE